MHDINQRGAGAYMTVLLSAEGGRDIQDSSAQCIPTLVMHIPTHSKHIMGHSMQQGIPHG